MKSFKKGLSLALLVVGVMSVTSSVEAGAWKKIKRMFGKVSKSKTYKNMKKETVAVVQQAAVETLTEATVAQAAGVPYDPIARMQSKTEGKFEKVMDNVQNDLIADVEGSTGIPVRQIKQNIDLELEGARSRMQGEMQYDSPKQ